LDFFSLRGCKVISQIFLSKSQETQEIQNSIENFGMPPPPAARRPPRRPPKNFSLPRVFFPRVNPASLGSGPPKSRGMN
jgi:hypothetical protein